MNDMLIRFADDLIADVLTNGVFVSPKEKFPLTNIINVSDSIALVELSVAGYTKRELSVYIESDAVRRKTLIVHGKPDNIGDLSKDYMTHEIIKKPFEKKWQIPSSYDIKYVKLVDGILKITMEKEVTMKKTSKSYDIG